jgi:CheY-like chemotaxis protein
MKVLYVEDQPVNVALMTAVFEMRPGLELQVATNGEEGYQAAMQDPPDLLLLDLRLPDCHGTELLARLRQHPALSGVPAAAVTADELCDLSASTFMETWRKPLDIHRVLSRLDGLQHQHAAMTHTRGNL